MKTIVSIIRHAALAAPNEELVFYTDEHTSQNITYFELYIQAQKNARAMAELGAPNQIVLLHLDSQIDYVIWFWSAIAAGMIPVVSTPLPTKLDIRDRHLNHIQNLLDYAPVITMARLKPELESLGNVRIITTEEIITAAHALDNIGSDGYKGFYEPNDFDKVAFMMLTSGSTGGAKAVEINHSQVLASLEGKSRTLGTYGNDVFLNWIGFDHVACVTEIHLHAMKVCAKQVHLPPWLPTQDPIGWLKQLSAHSVSVTFAPNFFLAAVARAMENKKIGKLSIHLAHLRHVVSGGEANTVSTGESFNSIVKSLGCKRDVVRPAFGMTESCAGSIYNMNFPHVDIMAGREFCSVGRAIHTMRTRIVDSDGHECKPFQDGELQLHGPAIFGTYHNNNISTNISFTNDGWFKTGDLGYQEPESGYIVLTGRSKDTIIINGVKYFSHEIEAAIESAASKYVVPSYTAAFAAWSRASGTEVVVVTFVPSEEVDNDEALSIALGKIGNAVLLHCSRQPESIIPVSRSLLVKSSLGKMSRFQLKRDWETSRFQNEINETKQRMSNYRRSIRRAPQTRMDNFMVTFFAQEFKLMDSDISLDDSMVDLGMDSIRLLKFKNRLQKQLGLQREIPIGLLLANPSVGGLAKAIDDWKSLGLANYDPVITLQTGKSEAAPIWFIHPGLGEVLVFLNISKYFSDRKVYALRAPGFNSGEEMFSSIDEMTDVYMGAIRRHQQEGPYILIGYSFGSMIAFETTKKLEAAGQKVFMGSLNGPPHIKWRMVQIDWCELFLNLSYFLGFLTEAEAVKKSAEFHQAAYARHEILNKVLANVSAERLKDLDLTAEKLAHWADVSSRLQGLAHNYDPTGEVHHIDVFYANPLLAVSNDKELWLEQNLRPWNDFCQEPVRFHNSPGAHYTMLDPDHVFAMQKILRTALEKRGV